jgi:hypothetical protein
VYRDQGSESESWWPVSARFSARAQKPGGKIQELGISTDIGVLVADVRQWTLKKGVDTWIWNMRTGETVYSLKAGEWEPDAPVFNPDGTRIPQEEINQIHSEISNEVFFGDERAAHPEESRTKARVRRNMRNAAIKFAANLIAKPGGDEC